MNEADIKNQMEISNYYQKLQSDNVVFAYKGIITNDLFDSILTLAEEKLSAVEHQMKLKRKVHVITVEILQNIFHHYDIQNKANNSSNHLQNTIIFILSKDEEEGYFIVAGNFVPSDEAENLKNRIESVNMLSPNELKLKYREVLNNGEFSDKGGAGLGIIDIARKSGQKLDYEFPFEQLGHSFFSLKVKVPVN